MNMPQHEIPEGKLIAGRWRVVAHLENDFLPSYRVRNTEGWDGELLVISDVPKGLQERIEAVDGLRHDNILAAVETGTWTKFEYIVRELIAGQTIAEWLWRDERLEYDQALGVACQLCLASTELAARGIHFIGYHPDTVRVDPNGFAKIDPFGLIDKSREELYRSPEELRGGKADERSDIFRIGLLIYYMLGGEPAKRLGQGMAERKPLFGRFIDVPKELDNALDRVLALDPAERPQNGEALLDILHPLLMSKQRLTYARPQSEGEEGAPPEIVKPRWYEGKSFWLYIGFGGLVLLGLLFVLQGLFSFFGN